MKKIFIFLLLFSSSVYAQKYGKQIGTLTLGVVLPLTGSQSSYGEDALTAIKLAHQELKETNPSLHKHVRLLVEDDKSRPSGAKAAGQQLIKQRASAMIGAFTHSTSWALSEVAQKSKKPLIIPAACSSEFLKQGDHVFRACTPEKWQGNLLSQFAYHDLKAKKAVVIYDPKSSHAHDIAQHFSASFKTKNSVSLHKELYSSGKNIDFSSLLQKAMDHKPDVLVFPSQNLGEIQDFLNLLARKRVKTPVLGVDSWKAPELVDSSRGPVESYFVTPYHEHATSKRLKNFVATFKKRKNRNPSMFAMMVYDAYFLVVHAFDTAQTSRSSQLVRTLSRLKGASGLLGSMDMNKERYLEKPACFVKMSSDKLLYHRVVSSKYF